MQVTAENHKLEHDHISCIARERETLLAHCSTLGTLGCTVCPHTAVVRDRESGLELVDASLVSGDEWKVPESSVPILADVQTCNWNTIAACGPLDIITMDPPWSLAGANPTRGVALGYSQLPDSAVAHIPIPTLQREGLLFVWVINAKYQRCLDMIEQWGYEVVDEVVWVKTTSTRRLAKNHGYYLQHAKEVCFIARKGMPPVALPAGIHDVLCSSRRGQSQKPQEIYELAERLVPGGVGF